MFKTEIGQLANGIDLSNSVENEFYCLKLIEAFGMAVNAAEIQTFGETKALVIERFDRSWTRNGRLLRLPQEDCCQALSVPPTAKYESDGGPGLVDILNLLKGSDTPADDQRTAIKAQLLFWLIGATDGHAKNLSIFLGPGGSFHLTPLYDVLTAQPSFDAGQIAQKQMTLAMSVGRNQHYRFRGIHARHFLQTGDQLGMPKGLVRGVVEDVAATVANALDRVEETLPDNFPEAIHASVKRAVLNRARKLELAN